MSVGMGKIGQIYDLSVKGKYVKVKLKDKRIIECTADCFGETELELDGEPVPDLRVELKDGGSEILIDNDIEEVIG